MAYKTTQYEGYILVENEGGETLSFSTKSGVTLLEQDGFAFKDLNKNGKLDPYEDWRLPLDTRIEDLVGQMSISEIAGLMLYSRHQTVSADANSIFAKMFGGLYGGKPLAESGADVTDLTDEQKQFLLQDDVRHVLVTVVDDAEVAAKWNNKLQALTESVGLGIPVNISTDPRHSAGANTEFNAGSGGDISKWPEPLGLAATFSPKTMQKFGEVAGAEYRAIGIATALSPQIDIATDPRWMRFYGTFGEDSKLSADMARAYCDGFQTTPEKNGWGSKSVNAMVKHWPGGGSGESGRDAHYAYGKYAVYPGDNFEEHMVPFTEGAFQLKGGTKQASAVMPYYTISYGQDKKNGENVGNGYSKYIITDLLRDKVGYDNVVCTDWKITDSNDKIDAFVSGKPWGVEGLSVAERHYKVLEAGVDQFGGNNEKAPVLEAYDMGVAEHGEAYMRAKFEASAKRLVRNMMQVGLFENPYLNPATSAEIVGCPAFMQEGYNAQLESIVLLKNKQTTLPIAKKKKVYIPKRKLAEGVDWFGNIIPAREEFPVSKNIVEKYYELVETPDDADFALVFIESPKSRAYTEEDEYLPISLQYRPYTATHAREVSLAGGDPLENTTNRSYKGKQNTTTNEADLDIVLETKQKMGAKPVVTVIDVQNPTVLNELEPSTDALMLVFGVSTQAVLDVVSGVYKPTGLLPFQMPADMETVETQFEDVAHDMTCYTDSEGHVYDFAFGMHYNSVIDDERVRTYKKK